MDKNNSVIIVAGGKGTRLGGDLPKQYLLLLEKPILIHTIERFDLNKNINEIIIVIGKEMEEYVNNLLSLYKFNTKIIIGIGGAERQHSVYNGLKLVNKNNNIVLIHDAVRPFVTHNIINNVLENVKYNLGVIPAVKVKDTIKIVNEKGMVVNSLNRDSLYNVQTPQGFMIKDILICFEKTINENIQVTDDASIFEQCGMEVKIIEGSYNNIKITTIEDLDIGNVIANKILINSIKV